MKRNRKTGIDKLRVEMLDVLGLSGQMFVK